MKESEIQKQIIEYLEALNIFCHAIPNRKESTRVVGFKKGVADLLVWHNNKDRPIYIELKTKTGVQSEAQKDFEKTCISRNIKYYICRSLEDVENILKEL